MAKKNLENMQFGYLTVIKDTGERASNGGVIWLCQCECGNECKIAGNNLTRAKNGQKTCGKCQLNKIKNIANQRFGQLVTIEPVGIREHRTYWKCKCDCGNITEVAISSLLNGTTQSCGCLRDTYKNVELEPNSRFGSLKIIEKYDNSHYLCQCDCGNNNAIIATRKLIKYNQQSCGECYLYSKVGQIYGVQKVLDITRDENTKQLKYKCECQNCGAISTFLSADFSKREYSSCLQCKYLDIKNQHFGKLHALSRAYTINNKSYWKCKCECGREVIVSRNYLMTSNMPNCGCLHCSQGEEKIKNLLLQNDIAFETQKVFADCRFPDTNALARFDFYLPEYNLLIEYDGEQHYREVSIWSDNLSEIQARDNFKTQWCLENQIQLKRISYKEIKNITIQDIL